MDAANRVAIEMQRAIGSLLHRHRADLFAVGAGRDDRRGPPRFDSRNGTERNEEKEAKNRESKLSCHDHDRRAKRRLNRYLSYAVDLKQRCFSGHRRLIGLTKRPIKGNRRPRKSTTKVDHERTIYQVDMGGRVGFVGGREGERKGNPIARRVLLVLEGNRVITAYPL